jgi:hypothetical protein
VRFVERKKIVHSWMTYDRLTQRTNGKGRLIIRINLLLIILKKNHF